MMLAWALGFLCGLTGGLLLARWAVADKLKKWRRATKLLHQTEEIANANKYALRKERELVLELRKKNKELERMNKEFERTNKEFEPPYYTPYYERSQ